jgi:hypothetical protein
MSLKTFLKKLRKGGRAVYWPKVGVGDDGQPRYGAAREVAVRWEDVEELFVDAGGEQKVSSAKVLFDSAEVQIRHDDVLRKGTVAQVPPALLSKPLRVSGAALVKKVSGIPDLKQKVTVDVAWL